MDKNTEIHDKITLRKAEPGDMEALKAFFIKAYGEKTIFQDERFLVHYFSGTDGETVFGNNLIGVDENGEIVSHYGGLNYGIKMGEETKMMVWGVSAYTLPAYRGLGINSRIVEYITQNFEINGVIGFSERTSLFYKQLGYNVFDFEKFSRHVLVLDHKKTLEACNYIGQDDRIILNHKVDIDEILKDNFQHKVIELTKENIDDYELNIDTELQGTTTTQRTKSFLKWRFLNYPYIKYALLAAIEGNQIVAYAASRKETLQPIGYHVNRIIDLYGKKEAITALLHECVKSSVLQGCIYIDFSKFGVLYEEELRSFQFLHLENEECCILPQVTSPIENRPNGEFLGIFSQSLRDGIQALDKAKVYFTRMDSDRDRLANTDQLNLKKYEQ